MKKKLIAIFLFLGFFSAQGQTAPNLNPSMTDTTKMRVWTNYCRNLCVNQNFSQLAISAKKGIALSTGNNRYSSIFYYYEGTAHEYTTRNDSLAICCYEKSLSFAKKDGDMEQIGNVIRRVYYLYFLYKKHDRETELIDYVKSKVNSIKNWEVKASFLVCICNSYLFHDEYEQFINYAFQTIDVYEHKLEKSKKNTTNIANLYRNIVGTYIQMGQYNKALEYCAITEKYCEPESVNLAYIYSYYAKIYSDLGQIELQKKYIRKIEALKENYFDKESCLGESYCALAENYLKINQLSEANKYIEKSIQAGILSKNHEVVVEAKTTKGKILYGMKEYLKAIELLLSIQNDAKLYDKLNYAEMLNTIAQSYKLSGNSNKAYKYLTAYSLERDTILKESAKKNIANAEAKYQNNIKQQEIKSLKAKNTIQQLEEEKSKSQIAVLLLVLLIVIGITSFTYFKYKERKKTNEKLQLLNSELDEANRIKVQFLGMLNHDLRSPISNIIHLIRLNQNNFIDATKKIELENTTIKIAENLLVAMDDMLLWSKEQMENYNPVIRKIDASIIFNYIQEYFETENKVKFQFENNENLEIWTDENFLKAIVRNLTSNSIKALSKSDSGVITWRTWMEDNCKYISITDNGVGTNKAQILALYDEKQSIKSKSGLGLHLIRDMAKAINCQISLDEKLESGTSFILKFDDDYKFH